MALFKKPIKDDLAYEEPSEKEKKFDLVKIVKSKFFIPAVAVVILLILIKVLFGVFASQKSDLGYYDTMLSLFTNELGSFSYTFSVETGDKGTIIKTGDTGSMEDLVPDSEAGMGDTSQSSKEFVDWDKYSEVHEDYWRHPVYRVSIVGTTMSLDPMQTSFTVSIATPHYNNLFTQVTVRDDTYYFDVESMYNWLINSSDSYLMSLAETIPHGSKWLEIPASEFAIPSRYAELGDEQELSEAHSIRTLYRRFLVTLQTAVNSVHGALGETGVDKSNDVVRLNLVGADALPLVNAAKSISTRSGDFYDAVLSSATSSGLYNESQNAQALREKDNFINAMSDLSIALQMCNASDLGVMASGQVRQYTNGYGNSQIEGTLGIQFSTTDTDYVIKFSGVRSGDQRDIVVPDGSKNGENADMYLACFNKIVDYFNFTNIRTDVKLSINPDTISEYVLDKFITLVNNTGSAGYYVTRSNVGEFISKYIDMSRDDAKSDNDVKNIALVKDLVTTLDKVAPRAGEVVTEPVDPVEPVDTDTEQYPSVEYTVDGAEVKVKFDAETSNHDLFVLNFEVINKGEDYVYFDCNQFSVHDLLASIYPANNETLIRNYDNTFDMEQLIEEVEVPPMGWREFKVYFVIPTDGGHADLFYGEEQLGAVIQF